MTEELERRLSLLIAIQRVAHRDALKELEEEIQSDRVSREILLRTQSWIDAGQLKSVVMSRTKASKPTIERRAAELVSQGVLERTGAGAHVRYRSTGLVAA